jgi:tRNA nucleotidyltransferase (CCA-adding enzyme)
MIKSYLVGGAVRDQLLGLQNTDRDYVVIGATEHEMIQQGFIKVGSSFPVFLHPETKEEYALARTERKTSSGYHGFSCQFDPTVTLEDDLRRRDLTINAIAFDGAHYIDPFNGMSDLQNRVLRPVSNAFKEDAIRVLRLARFQAKFPDFTLHDSCYSFVTEMKHSGELNSLQPERIRKEMEKAFKETQPSLFFNTLNVLGVLEIVFPELHTLVNIEQAEKCHQKNNAFMQTMMILDATHKQGGDQTCLYAALLHNLDKGITPVTVSSQHIDHKANESSLVKNFLKRFNISKNAQFIVNFTKYHLQVHQCVEMQYEKIINLLDIFKIKKTSDTAFKNLIICATAYAIGTSDARYLEEAQYLIKCVHIIEKLVLEMTKNIENAQKKQYVKQAKIRALQRALSKKES